MNMKKIVSGVMATAIVASMASVASFAAVSIASGQIVNNDGENVTTASGTYAGTSVPSGNSGSISADGITPDTTFFYSFGLGTQNTNLIDDNGANPPANVTTKLLFNKDYFKFDTDKTDGSKYLSGISLVSEKNMDGISGGRGYYVKFALKDSTTTDEYKIAGSVSFEAKADSSSYAGTSKAVPAGTSWEEGDYVSVDFTLWVNNTVKKGGDNDADTGDKIVFDPAKNDTNTMVWGDDTAALFFDASDDATKFYAKLSTKVPSSLYSEYGDPVGADLWVYDFVSHPTVPSTSKATLTLGIPWDEDKDIVPNPADCYLYEMDADGYLTDVTSKFTFSDDNDGTTGIAGWTIKTRTLGTYVLSDTELDVDVADDTTDEPTTSEPTTVVPDKTIPNTGSSDMVNVAVVAAVVSLAAAGAVAFRKVK